MSKHSFMACLFTVAERAECVCAFSHLLTSSKARLATFAFLSAGRVQQAHVRHLDSRSSLGNQLPGPLPQLPPPLCVPLLQTQNSNFHILKDVFKLERAIYSTESIMDYEKHLHNRETQT